MAGMQIEATDMFTSIYISTLLVFENHCVSFRLFWVGSSSLPLSCLETMKKKENCQGEVR